MRKVLMGLLGSLFLVTPAPAESADNEAQLGTLRCLTDKEKGYSLLISSVARVKCVFVITGGGGDGIEHYRGETGIGFGIDLNFNRRTKLDYSVITKHYKSGSYELAGKYYGGGGSATAGIGVGAQVLIGGSNKRFSLQPAFVGSRGAGVSAGLTYLYLEPDKEADPVE
ncbi:MAG: DUF992 domain-containing protein [Mariprofundaceae bacterium]|nr:DUF992 domain-containing protein [Mariprofundaceae bacterium]